MDTQGITIWQHAAGDDSRDYVDLCLRWDVILNGSGACGPWPDCRESLKQNGVKAKKITDLRRFCEDMEDSHVVVLRRGTNKVYAVGRIVGGYEHVWAFSDVDGWDVSHVRRVRWLWRYSGEPKRFETYTLKSGDTTQRLSAPAVLLWLQSQEILETDADPQLKPLPDNGGNSNLGIDTISEYLFDSGVASQSITNLLDQMGELVRIANWYSRSGESPSESETISYLVVPLLRTLGWTPQRMAIEWNKIDVALFTRLPRATESLAIVVEAKKIWSASLTALPQARGYAGDYENCRRLILTDGLRYGTFVRESGKFSLEAYMNLTDLRDAYPIYECKGAREALLAMSPESGNPG